MAGCGGDWWYLTPFLAQSFTRKLRTQRESLGFTQKRTEGRAPVLGSEFTSKDAALQGGMMVVLMQLFAAALVVYFKKISYIIYI